MREYRGKRIDTGEWVKGNLIRMKNSEKYGNNEVFSNCWIMRIEEELNVRAFSSNGVWVDNELIQVDPSTVGQYTGQIDSRGNEIFEGDILRVVYVGGGNATSISAVTYGEGCYMFEERNPFAPVFYKSTLRSAINHPNYNVTKLGNIHDNPELLDAE